MPVGRATGLWMMENDASVSAALFALIYSHQQTARVVLVHFVSVLSVVSVCQSVLQKLALFYLILFSLPLFLYVW